MSGSLPRFILIGALGFCVDAGLLAMCIAAGGGLYSARLVSFPTAVTVTWYFNRVWTFRKSATDRPRMEYVTYVGVQVVAAVSNFLVYATLLRWVLGETAQMAMLALAIGAVVGFVINYLGAGMFVFIGGKPSARCTAQDENSP